MNGVENGFRAPLVEELEPLFPSYQILSLIATGGMGAVYHAVQTSLEREVAIKVLPAEFGNDETFCESFAAEAKAMAKLNHPNLISVYDFGEVDEMLFIVMEYVSGKSLHEVCHRSAVDPVEAVRLMVGVSQGLAHAHEEGILHRDIKPANIMLDSKMQPKIGDFGLARPLDSQVEDGEIIYGTPGYTAPEVLATPKLIDQRADIFSLGVLIQELLTGMVPESEPRPPSSIVDCDSRFDMVVSKATSPNPSHRYQSATEIANELQKIVDTAGRSKFLRAAAPAFSIQNYSKYTPKKRGVGVVAALVLVGIVVIFSFWGQIFKKADPDITPTPGPVVVYAEKPIEPTPVEPTPDPVSVEPELVKPEITSSEPEPIEPKPVAPEPIVKELEPKPNPVKPEPVIAPKPKYDVESFFTHARSVMQKRCSPIIDDHDKSLKKNLNSFTTVAKKLIKRNLPQYIEEATSELNRFYDQCKKNENRMGKSLGGKLKFKPYLKDLHQKHQDTEVKIDGKMESAFAKQEKTYLYGLSLKVKELKKNDDPLAIDLVKAEVKKVKANATYFKDLMLEGHK